MKTVVKLSPFLCLLCVAPALADFPYSIFFVAGSAKLQGGGTDETGPDRLILAAVRDAAAAGASELDVTGYCSAADVSELADADSDENAMSFSRRRAQAVADALRADGLPDSVRIVISGVDQCEQAGSAIMSQVVRIEMK